MKRFAAMFAALDRTTSTNAKLDALTSYFADADETDALWTIALLSGKRPRRTVTTTLLRQWAAEESAIPLWLFEESYAVVGDLAETIALLLPPPAEPAEGTLAGWIRYIQDLKDLPDDEKRQRIIDAWRMLDTQQRFLFNKLMTGSFRVGVSRRLMTRALSKATDVSESLLAHRLMGDWTPYNTTYSDLILKDSHQQDPSKPYPFYLAYALDLEPAKLGDPSNWIAERKWDGIRGQLIVRHATHFLWSRGEELITDRFPEFAPLASLLPQGTAVDGEILAWSDDKPLPFQSLQQRIGRKTLSRKILSDVPAIMMVYDLLECEGSDVRSRPLSERRQRLEAILATIPAGAPLHLSPMVRFTDWDMLACEREAARSYVSEGLMLKRAESPYLSGRRRGDWWKWKVDPHTIDAVLVYAQSGSGRRANLFTDFTFAVPGADGALVPFTKAYSGLTDDEFREITAWVRRNTIERFGPVRRVVPEHVFELAFEGIQRSGRHKSGVALRFPRISRWRRDKKVEDANTLEDLHVLLNTPL